MTEDNNVVTLATPAVVVSLFTQGSTDPVVALAEEATKAWHEYRAANPQAFTEAGWEVGCWRTARVREAFFALWLADPSTLAGLAAKARVVRLSNDEEIRSQLARDIGLLAGEIDPNAIPEGFEAA